MLTNFSKMNTRRDHPWFSLLLCVLCSVGVHAEFGYKGNLITCTDYSDLTRYVKPYPGACVRGGGGKDKLKSRNPRTPLANTRVNTLARTYPHPCTSAMYGVVLCPVYLSPLCTINCIFFFYFWKYISLTPRSRTLSLVRACSPAPRMQLEKVRQRR